jgi:acyl-CoA synthetase (AMP-forming)/AMP-acid ligase II
MDDCDHDLLDSGEPLCALLNATGSRPALVCPDDERSLTVDELTTIIDELAGRLHALGVRRGDRVAIVLDDRPSGLALFLPCDPRQRDGG